MHVRPDFFERDASWDALEARWMQGLKDGGPAAEAAFTSLYTVYGKLFVKRLVRFGLPPAQAHEVAHDLWLEVMRAAPKWRGETPVRIYLLGFLRFARLRWFTKRKEPVEAAFVEADDGEGGAVLPPMSSSPEDLFDFERCVERALQRLGLAHPRAVQLLELHHKEGMSLDEMAKLLGSDAKLVKSQLFAARRKAEPELLPCLELWPNRDVRPA